MLYTALAGSPLTADAAGIFGYSADFSNAEPGQMSGAWIYDLDSASRRTYCTEAAF